MVSSLASRLRLPALLVSLFPAIASRADEVRFNRDLRPIMSDTCFHCHGFDAKTREAGLRLDLREEALKPAESGLIPIVPGKPEESEIIKRVFSTDRDELMPPTKAHKALTAAQKQTFKRWVAEGAKYESHWAYTPLVRPGVPPLTAPGRNAVDAFIQARLAEKKIAPSAEAPRARLLRRLSLDLLGLPPTPAEVVAFEKDPAPDACEKQVARLLASPHFGERMAVWWLDIARFADTVGFHGDQNQRIFPYRDYVIGAFNRNLPFDQFTVEQLAGDLLPNPTPEQRVATGYNRLNMMTREGGAQPAEYLAKYGAERVRAVAAAWFGSTFGCAECHDHKFDPIKTADFYALQAFFADVKQWGVYAYYSSAQSAELAGWSNDHPFPPEIEVESPYLQAQEKRAQAALDAHLATGRRALLPETPAGAAFEKWQTEARAFLAKHPGGWMNPPVNVQLYQGGKPKPEADLTIAEGLVLQLTKAPAKNEEYRVTLKPGAGRVAALRVELDPDRQPNGFPQGTPGTLRLSATLRPAKGAERKLAVAHAEASAQTPRYQNGAALLGIAAAWKLPAGRGEATPTGVWLLDPPVALAADDSLVVTLAGETAAPLRVSVSPLGALDPLQAADPTVRDAILADASQRTPEQARLVADTYLLSAPPQPGLQEKTKALAAKVREARGGKAWSLVTEAMEPLTVRVLPRGNWQDTSGPVTPPATPSFLPGRIQSTPEKRLTRLDLAHWLVSEANPITARAVMNRLWQQFFGTGLSAALDDLGSQGELPSHPELLDWLASEFRGRGWDVKHMITLMVTSSTYRQSSSLRPELKEIDPANRLLASQNPRRLDAEFIRDNALFIAGQLNLHDIGGPSVLPYQPAGYYDALQFPDRDYVASVGPEQWRRGVYMHWQRAFLHPALANFDAPARDECTALRTMSNTPQQALTLLNDPTFVEAARLLAARLLATPGADDAARIDQAFRLAVARAPREKERASLLAFLATQRDHYQATPDDAERLLRVGTAPRAAGDAAEHAAWTSLCRAVLNAQEVITRY